MSDFLLKHTFESVPRRTYSPTLGLSDLELKRVIEGLLVSRRELEPGSNWLHGAEFRGLVNHVRGRVDKALFLQFPELALLPEDGSHQLLTLPGLKPDIEALLAELASKDGGKWSVSVDQIRREREWQYTKKEQIVGEAVGLQQTFLQTWDDFDLQRVSQTDLGDRSSIDESTVSRLLHGLSVKPVTGKTFMAVDLVPGKSTDLLRGVALLRRLRGDPAFFQDGRWIVSRRFLMESFKQARMPLAERTLGKYLTIVAEEA